MVLFHEMVISGLLPLLQKKKKIVWNLEVMSNARRCALCVSPEEFH